MSRLDRLRYLDVQRTAGPVRARVRPRGVPASLEGREIFATDDPAQAQALLSAALARARLVVTDPARFAAHLHGVRFRDVSLLHLDLHGRGALDLPRCGPYYAVHMAMSGTVRAVVGGRPVAVDPVRALVTNPGDPLLLELGEDATQLVVRVEEAALVRCATRLLGRTLASPLVFDPAFDLASDAATRWHGALQVLHTEVLHPGSLTQAGTGIGALEEFVMSSLLMLQPSNHSDLVLRPTTPPGRRVVRAALDHIEAHLREPLTMAEIARHAGASIRSVQQGFREELGLSPMAYLRERRLERVREELLDAVPADGVRVTDVALHWGFTHLSGFAGAYRKRWGESPSQTLRG